MAIGRRLTEAQKVVCRRDPAIEQFKDEKIKDYVQTLDIEKLGSFADLATDVSVFTILPLQSKYESYIGEDTNFWLIFQAHVKNVTGLPFEVEYEDGKMLAKHRDDFPPEVVADIADIIVSLANRDGKSVFFSPPAGFVEFIRNCQLSRVRQAEADVNSTAAKIKSLSSQTNQKTTE